MYEVLLHPLRYRTELCKDFVQRGFCARDVCFFAHFPSEQRTPDEETMVRYNVLQAPPPPPPPPPPVLNAPLRLLAAVSHTSLEFLSICQHCCRARAYLTAVRSDYRSCVPVHTVACQ